MENTKELIHGSSEVNTISDINVTPFIDVMLVLLIIFMVTAPLMMGGVKINLPKTSGQPMPRPENPIIVSLDAESRIFVDKEEVAAEGRAAFFRQMAMDSESGEVFVRGDGEVKYAKMMDLMSELGQAGFARVTLVTNVQSAAAASAGDSAAPGTAPDAADGAPSPQAAPPAGSAAPVPTVPAAPAVQSPPAPANP
ncbi:MAG: biopolymer transporter ExbD [Deltaproteobacteria bacterium]|jgi:biopolymer transport protein ExbD|nr:biopolymer transporter ExbD [Deltaproteobacteria bacterium]